MSIYQVNLTELIKQYLVVVNQHNDGYYQNRVIDSIIFKKNKIVFKFKNTPTDAVITYDSTDLVVVNS